MNQQLFLASLLFYIGYTKLGVNYTARIGVPTLDPPRMALCISAVQ